jgi:hypothetical protein
MVSGVTAIAGASNAAGKFNVVTDASGRVGTRATSPLFST